MSNFNYEISKSQMDSHLQRLRKKVWKVIPMYEEECETIDLYTKRLARQLNGCSILYDDSDFLEMASILLGLDSNRGNIKSDIFKVSDMLKSKYEKE